MKAKGVARTPALGTLVVAAVVAAVFVAEEVDRIDEREMVELECDMGEETRVLLVAPEEVDNVMLADEVTVMLGSDTVDATAVAVLASEVTAAPVPTYWNLPE